MSFISPLIRYALFQLNVSKYWLNFVRAKEALCCNSRMPVDIVPIDFMERAIQLSRLDSEYLSRAVRGTDVFIDAINRKTYVDGIEELLIIENSINRQLPYNISERVSYVFILYLHQRDCLNPSQLCKLKSFATFLTSNMEYYGATWTNNHFLNNVRSIIFIAHMTKDADLLAKGLSFLELALLVLFKDQGYRERSTSYLLLIQYWLKSISVCIGLFDCNKKRQINILQSELIKLIKQFHVECIERLNFGDNTPDFSKSNIVKLSGFFDQFFENISFSNEKWLLLFSSAGKKCFFITSGVNKKGPEHGHRNLGCFSLLLDDNELLFQTNSRAAYGVRSNTFPEDPGFTSSGHIMINGKELYATSVNLPIFRGYKNPRLSPKFTLKSLTERKMSYSVQSKLHNADIAVSITLDNDEICFELVINKDARFSYDFLLASQYSFNGREVFSKGRSFQVLFDQNSCYVEEIRVAVSEEYGSTNTQSLIRFHFFKKYTTNNIMFKEVKT